MARTQLGHAEVSRVIPYILIAFTPVVAGMTTRRYPSVAAMAPVILIFVLFMGLRFQVGPDWSGYEILHELTSYKTWEEIWSGSEPLSFALFAIDKQIGAGMVLSNVVASAILIVGVVAFARRTPLPWLAFLSAMPYLVIVFGMSGIRQAMGVGVTLFVLSRWRDWGIFGKLGGILVGALFHTSAILLAIVAVFGVRMRLSYRIAAAIPLAGLVVVVATSSDAISDNLAVYGDRYVGEGQRVSGGALFHILLILGPALAAFVWRRRLMQYVLFPDLLYMGIAGAFIALAFNFVSSTGASRLTLYLYFVPMLVYPAIAMMQPPKNQRAAFIMLSLSQPVLLILWLLTANTASPYFPYRNVLFS